MARPAATSLGGKMFLRVPAIDYTKQTDVLTPLEFRPATLWHVSCAVLRWRHSLVFCRSHDPRHYGSMDMKKVTHYKMFDQDRWRAVPVPHLINLNRFRVSEITGKKYVFVAGVSARCLRFSDGSEYHADGFWS